MKRSPRVDPEAHQDAAFPDIWIQVAIEDQDIDKTRLGGNRGTERRKREYSLPNNLPSQDTPGHDGQLKHCSSTENVQNLTRNKRLSPRQPPFIDNRRISADHEDYYDLWSASRQGKLKMVRKLLANGADINISCNGGATPLHEASLNGHLKIVQLLIMEGANIKATDIEGWTALHAASYGGHLTIVDLLIEEGAEFRVTETEGWTPLHCASDQGHVDVAKLLIDKRANVTAIDKSMLTPLRRAELRGHDKLKRFLEG
jgi:ankyrin repeat protein